ncbi:RloB family protein [Nonomuraea coxensis]|uniref:RloB family protein n=1 Tax=Nonomuraea coxensis TaxID=404386 RepID=UPI00037E61B9|nr:RloB family protein [Nonomuraea coxensis]
MLILTNGVKTEKQYFDALRKHAWGNPFHVSVKNCAPIALVESAMAEKSNACGIGMALSQPCFEVWLILHKKDFRKSAHHAKEVEAELSKILPRWDKSTLRMEDFWEGIEDAIRRAKALGEPPESNPSTAVWEVMEVLRASAEEPSSS